MPRLTVLVLAGLAACSNVRSTQKSQVEQVVDPSGDTTVMVDTREELFGIVFRLAGVPPYRQAKITRYVNDVDVWFGNYVDHPAVEATRLLRSSHDIGFDAPQTLLVYLDRQLKPRRQLSSLPPGVDARWNDDGY